MRRLIRFPLIASLALAASGPASANDSPPPNGHNCAGVVVGSLAGPGFGGTVAAAAHAQAVDNSGLANCGNTERKNP